VKRGILAIGMATLALALATGCGDDSEASITRAEFVEQGNAVCKEVLKAKTILVNQELAQRKKEGKSLELNEKSAVAVLAVALPPLFELPDKLRQLEVPEGEEEKVETIIKSYETGVSEMEEDPGNALQINYPFEEADELAEKYGLNLCQL